MAEMQTICAEVYFNSIKVRLEHSILFETFLDFPEFQFHKGAIRTIISHTCRIDGNEISIP